MPTLRERLLGLIRRAVDRVLPPARPVVRRPEPPREPVVRPPEPRAQAPRRPARKPVAPAAPPVRRPVPEPEPPARKPRRGGPPREPPKPPKKPRARKPGPIVLVGQVGEVPPSPPARKPKPVSRPKPLAGKLRRGGPPREPPRPPKKPRVWKSKVWKPRPIVLVGQVEEAPPAPPRPPRVKPARPARPAPVPRPPAIELVEIPARPARPEPEVEVAPVRPVMPPRRQEEILQLGRELKEMMDRVNRLYQTLAEAGEEESAQAILGAFPVVRPPPAAVPVAPAGPPPAVPAEPALPAVPAEPAEPVVPPEPGGPPPEKEERYFLKGPGIYVPFISDLHLAYQTLAKIWKDANIGSVKGDKAEPRPPFAPDSVVRGSEMDPGTRVPTHALRSEAAFVAWAEGAGYKDGLAVEVDGLIAPPGTNVVISPEEALRRGEGDRKRTWWTPEFLGRKDEP